MEYLFELKSGSIKEGGNTYKFWGIVFAEGAEHMHFNALKLGYVKKSTTLNLNQSAPNKYVSFFPYFKIFMAASGFDARKMYYSFFFEFLNTSDKIYTITPFPDKTDQIGRLQFKAKGRFLNPHEVKDLYNSMDSAAAKDSYMFYLRQPFLSKVELSSIITVERLGETGVPTKGMRRKIR